MARPTALTTSCGNMRPIIHGLSWFGRQSVANDTLQERSRLSMPATPGCRVSTTTWLATSMPMFLLIADYFSFLLRKLAEDRALGLVGTPFKEGTNPTYDYRFVSIEHVSGACQLFRRECFEQIGGYVPVKGGCIDHIAVISARMKGWKTRTFTDKVCLHHRQMGTAQDSLVMARFRNGRKDYVIGNHPVWELFRAAYQMTKKPVVIGGLMLVFGYVWALIRQVERPVSPELVAFYRSEQMQRLKKFFSGNRVATKKTVEHPPPCA